jgi:hypothetical protein
LRVGQVMSIGKVLHPNVPPAAMLEVHELLDQHTEVLPANAGHTSVDRAGTTRPMADGAVPEVFRSPIEVGSNMKSVDHLLAGSGGRQDCQRCDQRRNSAHSRNRSHHYPALRPH